MSAEHIHKSDRGHVLAEKSEAAEYRPAESLIVPPVEPDIRIANPHGNFHVVKPGETQPHDIGCLCPSCVARRREQAQRPEFRAIVEARAAKLPPDQAEALRRALYGEKTPWWRRLLRR